MRTIIKHPTTSSQRVEDTSFCEYLSNDLENKASCTPMFSQFIILIISVLKQL